jgi:hypothetical protein
MLKKCWYYKVCKIKFLSPPEASGLSKGNGDEMGKFLSPPEASGLSEGKGADTGAEMGKC